MLKGGDGISIIFMKADAVYFKENEKGGVITLYEKILREYKRLEKQSESIQEELQRLPEGKLICCRDGAKSKWYRSDGHQRTYIPKKDFTLASQLARKKYLTLKLDEVQKEKCAIGFYLNHHTSVSKADALLTESSEYQKLLSGHFALVSTELEEWKRSPYDKNNTHPERLVYKSVSGNLVRSKSEMMIDMLLFQHQIPYRYECAIKLGNTVVYPDFTVRHPMTGEIYYWEHFGLMDRPDYAANAILKLQTYTENGILPGIHLITTFETQENPLDSEWVERLIEYYFL